MLASLWLGRSSTRECEPRAFGKTLAATKSVEARSERIISVNASVLGARTDHRLRRNDVYILRYAPGLATRRNIVIVETISAIITSTATESGGLTFRRPRKPRYLAPQARSSGEPCHKQQRQQQRVQLETKGRKATREKPSAG